MSQRPLQATPLDTRGLVEVGGAESREFLQGLVTNDVDLVDLARPIYAALLTPQGKFLHDFIIVQIGEALVLDTERTRVAELVRRLTMYRLRAKVDLRDISEEMTVCAVFGEGAGGVASAGLGAFVADPRSPALGYRLYSATDPCAQLESLGALVVSAERYDAMRVELGIPDGSRDIPVDKSFPLEYGFDSLGAVSYDKGCYVGQELTARTHNRGRVKKGLYRLAFDSALPIAGTDILMGDTVVGEVLSGSGHFALAHMRIDAVGSNQPLRAGSAPVADSTVAPISANR
ncbi:MAG: folate-binding protein [Proteobacteria bacterium]|nr:folate-binding protein [Pseudomonadota bacterium]MDA1057175.1 folate-binding protein [Pseudomonadota bacterium]